VLFWLSSLELGEAFEAREALSEEGSEQPNKQVNKTFVH